MDLKQLINEADKQYKDFIVVLPTKVSREDVSRTSLSALKAHLIRAGLLHRTADISKAVISLYKQGSYLPAIVLARSSVETFAVLHYFRKKLEKSVESGNSIEIDETLMRVLFGDRESDDGVDAVNVLTVIDKLDKEVDGIRSLYDSLCEVAHPNWSGTVGYYGKVQDHIYSLSFEPPHTDYPVEVGLCVVSAILGATLDMDESLRIILSQFTELHERAEEGDSLEQRKQ